MFCLIKWVPPTPLPQKKVLKSSCVLTLMMHFYIHVSRLLNLQTYLANYRVLFITCNVLSGRKYGSLLTK
jgi:hypothetical protein